MGYTDGVAQRLSVQPVYTARNPQHPANDMEPLERLRTSLLWLVFLFNYFY